jgi:hypothetical protein
MVTLTPQAVYSWGKGTYMHIKGKFSWAPELVWPWWRRVKFFAFPEFERRSSDYWDRSLVIILSYPDSFLYEYIRCCALKLLIYFLSLKSNLVMEYLLSICCVAEWKGVPSLLARLLSEPTRGLNLLFLQEWVWVLSFRLFEYKIRRAAMEGSSFMEVMVLEVTRKSYFQIWKSVRS